MWCDGRDLLLEDPFRTGEALLQDASFDIANCRARLRVDVRLENCQQDFCAFEV